ncbi:MAG: shikimate kinase [Myxococcota bacterium]|nr:shikimate kinase [Myxococcota bacterium]
MATGKSTVGPLVARQLGVPFVDLDALVAKNAGMEVAAIFASRGEPGFRALEREALGSALEQGSIVLALGGGTLHQLNNLERIQAAMDIVILEATLATIKARGGKSRPLWSRAEQLLAERQPLYRRAGPQIQVDGLTPERIASRVIAATGGGEQGWF